MRLILVIIGSLILIGVSAQTSGSIVRKGNKKYEVKDYDAASMKYLEAIEKEPELPQATFNLGNSQYRKEQYESAETSYRSAITKLEKEGADKKRISNYYYNSGNALFNQKKLDESIEAYKQALRNDPDNDNARHNLYLSQLLKKQQDQQKQQQDKNKDKKDQDKQKEQNKDQQQDQKDQGKQDQQQNKDQNEQQGQQPQPNQISKEDAERILKALEQDEKETRDKLEKEKAKATKVRSEKEW